MTHRGCRGVAGPMDLPDLTNGAGFGHESGTARAPDSAQEAAVTRQ